MSQPHLHSHGHFIPSVWPRLILSLTKEEAALANVQASPLDISLGTTLCKQNESQALWWEPRSREDWDWMPGMCWSRSGSTDLGLWPRFLCITSLWHSAFVMLLCFCGHLEADFSLLYSWLVTSLGEFHLSVDLLSPRTHHTTSLESQGPCHVLGVGTNTHGDSHHQVMVLQISRGLSAPTLVLPPSLAGMDTRQWLWTDSRARTPGFTSQHPDWPVRWTWASHFPSLSLRRASANWGQWNKPTSKDCH